MGSTVSEETERIERQILAPSATLAAESKGRERDEPRDELRTAFQRDRDRIIHCTSFRRLKHKTQVFPQVFGEVSGRATVGDHFTVRMTHTLEVQQIARTIARALRLNEDLTEGIALGHDLGHTPFGHVGEGVLSKLLGRKFHHAEQSLRIVEVLENDGRGLNLTWEVRDGIVGHSWAMPAPATLEAWIVRFADRIAYLNHDLTDAMRAGIITLDDVPETVLRTLGRTHSERINTLVMGVVEASTGRDTVEMEPDVLEAMEQLRRFMFKNVYLSEVAQTDRSEATTVITRLFDHYVSTPTAMPDLYNRIPGDARTRAADYVAGMTDRYAFQLFKGLEA
ncbi:MAG: deoxyguanosinetriphosphate triphosphohydrolase [Actinomycetota bacterium]